MKNELITAVIPVYNVEQYLEECVESLFAQTYENIEILAVNDGSTDGSRTILERLREKDNRLRILDKENGGLSDARNFGIAEAKGRYICFIDGDDTIAPAFIEHLHDAIQDADISVCDMEYVYEDGRREYRSGGAFTQANAKTMPSLIRINNSACNKLYRTSLFEEIRFPKGKLYEDLATVPIQIYRSSSVAKVNEPLYFYRQREGSIQHKADERIFHIYDAVDRLKSYVICHGNEPEILDEINRMYLIYGLDIVTLKIKDMDDREVRVPFLKQNMALLKAAYPDYKKDPFMKEAPLRKKIIYTLLGLGMYDAVLRIYDR